MSELVVHTCDWHDDMGRCGRPAAMSEDFDDCPCPHGPESPAYEPGIILSLCPECPRPKRGVITRWYCDPHWLDHIELGKEIDAAFGGKGVT